jgi:hypothetical protein
MWTYSDVKMLHDALTERSLHYAQKRDQLRRRQNASSETRKKQIFQKAGQVTEKNCDAEIHVEPGLGKPDFRMAEKQLSIAICEGRVAASFPTQHQETDTGEEDR